MVRQHDTTAVAATAAHDQLWQRASERQQRQIEHGFCDFLGSDLVSEIESAQSPGTAEQFAMVGRWLASQWVEYRNEKLDQLVAKDLLQ